MKKAGERKNRKDRQERQKEKVEDMQRKTEVKDRM